MAAPLQAKVQLLAVLAIAFMLLAVPLFYQVRADAQNSKETAKSTFLSKLFRDLAKQIRNKPPEDLQVEDAWQKWQNEHPNCGAECDPNADPDGDGRSNKQEVEEGRNPYCNEEKEGADYCAGRPKDPPPKPNATQALDDQLYYVSNAQRGHSASFDVPLMTPNYDRWLVRWSVTGYSGLGEYRVILRDPGGVQLCCAQQQVDFLASSHSGQQTLEGNEVPPSGATYRISLDAGSVGEGTWALEVRGLRDARGSP